MELMGIEKLRLPAGEYGISPTLPFDIKGVLTAKDGKQVKVESTVGEWKVEYSLKLKRELSEEVRSTVEIATEDIVSCRVEEKCSSEGSESEISSDARTMDQVVEELGLAPTPENRKRLAYLMRNGIALQPEELGSVIRSGEHLQTVLAELNAETAIKLRERGLDLEREGLQKIAEALTELKKEYAPRSVGELFRRGEMSYEEAEAVAKELYGQRMGRDIYDIIMALSKAKLPIHRTEVDRIAALLRKTDDLRRSDAESYAEKLMEAEVSIQSLYRFKHAYTSANLSDPARSMPSLLLERYDESVLTRGNPTQILLDRLKELDLPVSRENLEMIRQLLTFRKLPEKRDVEHFAAMKSTMDFVLEKLDPETSAVLYAEGFDVETADVRVLETRLREREASETGDGTESILSVKMEILDDAVVSGSEQAPKNVRSIGLQELGELIRRDLDFNLSNLRLLEEERSMLSSSLSKTAERVLHFSKMFEALGERVLVPAIRTVVRDVQPVSLQLLYETGMALDASDEVSLTSVDAVRERLIYEEVVKARSTLTVRVLQVSVSEGILPERMELSAMNQYIQQKLKEYRKYERNAPDLREWKGKSDFLVARILNNELDMSWHTVREMTEFLSKGGLFGGKLSAKEGEGALSEELNEEIGALIGKLGEGLKAGEPIRAEYRELLELLSANVGQEGGTDQQGEGEEQRKALRIHEYLNRRETMLQIPVELDGSANHLNVFFPKSAKAVDRNHMNFFLSLSTQRLGMVEFSMEVMGKNIYLELREDHGILKGQLGELSERLARKGYHLFVDNERVLS